MQKTTRIKTGLEIFVPMRIFELQSMPIDDLRAILEEKQQSKYFQNNKINWDEFVSAESIKEFNELVDLIALLSFAWGGINFFDLHFESKTESGEVL